MSKIGAFSYLLAGLFLLLATACTNSPSLEATGVAVEPPKILKVTKETYLSGKKFCETYSEITSKEHGRFISVPKDYKNPYAGSLEIYVYSMEAFNSKLPTYIYVNGGPGQNTHGYRRDFLKGRYNELNFDQRGLGCSAPENWDEYKKSDLYSTENTIKDMEMIRQAFEIDQWTVYGISYGTVPATMYASKYPEATHSVVLEGVYDSVENTHQLSYKLAKLNLVLTELSSIQKEAFLNLVFEDSADADTIYNITFESFFEDLGQRNLKNMIVGLIGPNGEIDRAQLKKIREEEAAYSSAYAYPQQPGSIDANIMDIIECRDLSYRHKVLEKIWYNDELGFYAKPNGKTNDKLCDEAGVDVSEESPFKVKDNLILAPVYYFQGSHDGATMAAGAIAHWKIAPQNESYFMMAQKGGHNPNSAKLRSRSVKLQKAQTELFYKAISAQTITVDDIDDVNIMVSPANSWKLYLGSDRALDTGIEGDLEGISAFRVNFPQPSKN